MLLRTSHITKFSINSKDETFGSVLDVYFDDVQWRVRYLVVDTGKWIPGHVVLLSPSTLDTPLYSRNTLPVTLTRQEIKEAPGIDSALPISRQLEADSPTHFLWPTRWCERLFGGSAGGSQTTKEADTSVSSHDPHLRSVAEVIGYDVRALGDEFGRVADFVVDPHTWTVEFVLVKSGAGWQRKKTLVSTHWFNRIDWEEQTIVSDHPLETIMKTPQIPPAMELQKAQ